MEKFEIYIFPNTCIYTYYLLPFPCSWESIVGQFQPREEVNILSYNSACFMLTMKSSRLGHMLFTCVFSFPVEEAEVSLLHPPVVGHWTCSTLFPEHIHWIGCVFVCPAWRRLFLPSASYPYLCFWQMLFIFPLYFSLQPSPALLKNYLQLYVPSPVLPCAQRHKRFVLVSQPNPQPSHTCTCG